jgi:hypothetical protein
VKHVAERGNHGIGRYRLLPIGFGGHCDFPPPPVYASRVPARCCIARSDESRP